ncbi:hypothetical protein GCM10011488_21880 [Steroidobacter agaridevorans]|nr:hypothetical protein GCM10011488_21880 [Steroidobacter agaridevorans]
MRKRTEIPAGQRARASFRRTPMHMWRWIGCDQITLPAQDAAALALLANEAVTNAYEHAFANESVA